MIADSLNPEFVTEIPIDYYFELQQNITAEVYDVDDANSLHDHSKQDYVGHYDFPLGKLISSPN